MGKPKLERQLKDNEARAVARTIRVSPQKLNLVAAMIRGKNAVLRERQELVGRVVDAEGLTDGITDWCVHL